MKRIRKLLSLTAGEQRLLVSAAIWLVIVRSLHVVLPFRTLIRLPKLVSAGDRWGGNGRWPPERIARAVQAVGRYLPGMQNCLVQALTVQVMLARRNYSAHLHIGVAKGENGQLKAHAWVECEGRIVSGSAGVSQYTLLPLFGDLKP